MLIHRLLCVEKNVAFAARGRVKRQVGFRWRGVYRGVVLIPGLLSVETEVTYAPMGWIRHEGVPPARRWGGRVHRDAVQVHGLFREELEVALAAMNSHNNSSGLAGNRCGGRVHKGVVLIHCVLGEEGNAAYTAGGSPVDFLGSGARW